MCKAPETGNHLTEKLGNPHEQQTKPSLPWQCHLNSTRLTFAQLHNRFPYQGSYFPNYVLVETFFLQADWRECFWACAVCLSITASLHIKWWLFPGRFESQCLALFASKTPSLLYPPKSPYAMSQEISYMTILKMNIFLLQHFFFFIICSCIYWNLSPEMSFKETQRGSMGGRVLEKIRTIKRVESSIHCVRQWVCIFEHLYLTSRWSITAHPSEVAAICGPASGAPDLRGDTPGCPSLPAFPAPWSSGGSWKTPSLNVSIRDADWDWTTGADREWAGFILVRSGGLKGGEAGARWAAGSRVPPSREAGCDSIMAKMMKWVHKSIIRLNMGPK